MLGWCCCWCWCWCWVGVRVVDGGVVDDVAVVVAVAVFVAVICLSLFILLLVLLLLLLLLLPLLPLLMLFPRGFRRIAAAVARSLDLYRYHDKTRFPLRLVLFFCIGACGRQSRAVTRPFLTVPSLPPYVCLP